MTEMKKVKVKIPTRFQPLYLGDYRNKLYYGGRGGGKSYAFADSLLVAAQNRKLRIVCLCEFLDSIKD